MSGSKPTLLEVHPVPADSRCGQRSHARKDATEVALRDLAFVLRCTRMVSAAIRQKELAGLRN